MQIISHRGYWKTSKEKNSHTALERSFSMGFGTETDFRDHLGDLVVAHDPPNGPSIHHPAPLAADFCFRLLAQHDARLTLAINIKSDGLQNLIKTNLERYGIENYFLFDMSVPDAVRSIKAGLRCFTRHSDLEPEPSFYGYAHGVWMDSFDRDWITVESIERHLLTNKDVCLVSPELHSRDHLPYWTMLREGSAVTKNPRLILCTDLPEDALAFFN
jgi:hypothetical protein